LKNTILKFIKKPSIRNVFILASGTAIAQVINMLFSPLITRLYGPEAYGVMGTFTAIVQIIGPIAALSYPIAIVLPKYDKEAKKIVKLSFFITLINTLIISFLLVLFGDFIIDLFNIGSISQFLYLIPVALFSAGIYQIIQQWLVRKNRFQISAKANLLETAFVNIGKLTTGLFYPHASILVFFTAFRQGLRAVLMYVFSGKEKLKEIFSLTDNVKDSILTQAKKHRDFPLYRAPEVTLSAVSSNTPVLLLTSFFGPAAAGFYSIARSVLGIPSTLIAKSVGDVFYPRVSKAAQNRQQIAPLIIKATFYLALIGLIPYGIIMLFGPWLFSLVFGQDWAIAGQYARWVSLWSFFNFINRPSVQSLPVIDAQKFQLIFTTSKLIITSLALLIGFFVFNSDIIAIALFGITGGLSYLTLIIITIFKSKKFDDVKASEGS